MWKKLFLCVILCGLLPLTVGAQDFDVDPNANISWPPPVYVLRGDFELRGTANLPNMASYFIEYRGLNEDLSSREDDPWLPATLPSTSRVVDDVLGVWQTALAGDGLYELRMTINVTSGSPVFVIVSPLRVENTPPPFAASPTPVPTATPVIPTLVPTPVTIPTLVPTPTAIDLTPRAEVVVGNANVRQGDSTFYPVITGLNSGTVVEVIGLSNTGSGWYQVRLPSGGSGWMAPSVVRVTGDTRNLPRVAPPPPPPPTPTPTPVTQANLAIRSISINPDPPTCRSTFTITVQVVNNGTGPSSSGGNISVQDVHLGSGTVTASTNGVFPPLNPGQTFDSVMRLTVDTYFNETHRLNISVDTAAQVPETNEGDNFGSRDYTLRRGDC
jgi:hypothetical protein